MTNEQERSREHWEGFRRGPWGMADKEYWMNEADFVRAHAEWKARRPGRNPT
jgi:hypothetical protein